MRPAPTATGFGDAKAGVFALALAGKVDVPVRECRPYQSGERIDDEAELVFGRTLAWRYSTTRGCATPGGAVYCTLVLGCRKLRRETLRGRERALGKAKIP